MAPSLEGRLQKRLRGAHEMEGKLRLVRLGEAYHDVGLDSHEVGSCEGGVGRRCERLWSEDGGVGPKLELLGASKTCLRQGKMDEAWRTRYRVIPLLCSTRCLNK